MVTPARRLVYALPLLVCSLGVIGLTQAPPATAEPAVGITQSINGDEFLTTFDTGGGAIIAQRRITGLTRLDVAGLAIRPSTGQLLVIDSSDGPGANDASARVYTLDYATGVATPLPSLSFSTTLVDEFNMGFAVNPLTDEIRMTSASAENLRISPVTGALLGADTPLAGVARGPALAYDRSAPGASATTLYAIDTNFARLNRIGGIDGVPSPNGGTVTPIGASLGIGVTAQVGLAISARTGVAYMSNPQSDGTSTIHTVNLTTGVATAGGVLDSQIFDIALLPSSSVQFAAPTASVPETAGAASVAVTRTGDMRVPTTVSWTTADASAAAGSDYVASTGSLDFAPGVTSRTVQVPVLVDAIQEGPETFTVQLTGSTGGSTLAASTNTVTITPVTPVTSVPPVVPPADVTAPTVLALPLAARSVRAVGTNGIVARFSCSEACTASVRLMGGGKVLGASAVATLASAGVSAVRVRTTRFGQARLVALATNARTRRVRLVALLSVRDSSGNVRVVRLPVVAFG